MQQAILACLGDHPGQYSRSGVAKLLAGSQSSRASAMVQSPYYGRLAGHGRKEITFQVDMLLQQGYLALDHQGLLYTAPGIQDG